jgi:hypothetical protein
MVRSIGTIPLPSLSELRSSRLGIAAGVLSAVSFISCARRTPTLSESPGTAKAIPQNTFRIMPYFDLPVFQISQHVQPGTRLIWRWDENGKLQQESSNPLLVTVAETPFEVTRQEIAVEKSEIQKRITEVENELELAKAGQEEESARVRLNNAQQESDRVSGLQQKGVTSQETIQRARNTTTLATVQTERAEQVRKLQAALSEQRQIMAQKNEENTQNDQSEALDKRERYGWLSIPFARFSGPNKQLQLVVTEMNLAYGDQPPRQGGKVPVWIELVDDSTLHIYATIDPKDEEYVRSLIGKSVAVEQNSRQYSALIAHILPVADQLGDDDPRTYRTRVLLTVTNDEERRLHIDSGVSVNFLRVLP